MKTLNAFFLCLLCQGALQAQISQEKIQQELAGKDWKIIRYETFGVEEEPRDEQKNDLFRINSNMTFKVVENGTEYTGSWTLNECYITCKSKNGSWQKTYKVISIEPKTASLEYKDPDLTRTLYRMALE